MADARRLVVLDIGPVLFADALARALSQRGMSVVSAHSLSDDDAGPFDLALVQVDGPVRHDADVIITLHSASDDGAVASVTGRSGEPVPITDLDSLSSVIEEHLVRRDGLPGCDLAVPPLDH